MRASFKGIAGFYYRRLDGNGGTGFLKMVLSAREIVEDRALGAVVPVTMLSEVLERLHHRLELGDLRPELFNVLASDSFHGDAGARFVVPEAQQLADIVGRKAQGARAPDEAQRVHPIAS
jgi:hypothetical protein